MAATATTARPTAQPHGTACPCVLAQVHPAVLDVTCELPLQVQPPAYLNLAVRGGGGPGMA